jgi:hypothetical protein
VEPIIIWDLDDEPEGNVQHIAEHGISKRLRMCWAIRTTTRR